MKRFIPPSAALALALGPIATSAQGASGMSGFVLDAQTQAPIRGVRIVVARDETAPRDKHEVTTNRDGFFSDLGLPRGRYIIVADVRGRLISCVVNDIREGVVRRVKMLVGRTSPETRCEGSTIGHQAVDPDETASLYRVR